MQRPEAGELLKSYIVPVTAPDQVMCLHAILNPSSLPLALVLSFTHAVPRA